MDEEGPAICWVCRDPDRPEPLVAPCRCRGSMRGVHASCIESWVAARSQQRLRPDLQGGDHTQPRICCDLCGEPYQAEHHPAHLCDCLKAHLQSCWAELREEIRSIGLRWVCGMLLANCWLTCVMMGMAILVSGLINKACHANEKWQCGLAVFFYVAFLLTLICESLVILVSFPWTATPPGRCFVLRPFFLNTLHNQTMKAMVVLFWAHLWMVPFMSVVTCAGVEYTSSHLEKKEDVEVRCSWDLFALLCVPALLPHLKHGFVTLWGCSWQRCRAAWHRLCEELRRCGQGCTWENGEVLLSVISLILNPSFCWLQTVLAFPFGVAWFSPGNPTARYAVVITSVSIGLPAALYAWLRLLCKGPMHRDYLCPFEDAFRMHAGWFGALAFLLYSAFSVYAQQTWLSHKKRDPVAANVVVWVVWSIWSFLVASYALYANGITLWVYSHTWRNRHGRLHIGGEAVNT